MKVINKIISRNEFISRKNGVIPSLIDEWIIPGLAYNGNSIGEESENCVNGILNVSFGASACGGNGSERKQYIFNSYQSAVAKANELGITSSIIEYKGEFIYQDHNYGLIVSDVIVPNNIASTITDYTDYYVNIPDPNNEGEYYNLFNEESYVHYKYVDGSPTRNILSGGTEIKILTYTTLNKWYSFFKWYKEKFKPYSTALEYYKNEYKVKNSVNEKRFYDIDAIYKSRGGDTMYSWIEEYCMPHDNDLTPKSEFNYATYSASYNIPILFTKSIDDLGQMSSFSSKWESGVDYHNTAKEKGFKNKMCNDYPYICYGTVVDRPYTKDDNGNVNYKEETYVISGESHNKGYETNKYYENEFKSTDWVSYTSWCIGTNNKDFEVGGLETYAISPINGEVIYNPESCSATKIIDYVKEDFIIYNGEYIKVVNGEYVTPNYVDSCYADVKLKRGKKLPIIEDGPLKYAELNGKKFYVVSDGDKELIYFTKSSDCHGSGSLVKSGRYVIYNGNLFLADENSVVFEDNDGNKIINTILNGYFEYNGSIYYVLNNEVVAQNITNTFNDDSEEIIYYSYKPLSDEYKKIMKWNFLTVDSNNKKVSICYLLDIKKANIVSGYTDSKLEILRRRKINVDELGNELPGYLDLFTQSINNSYYNTPYDQCTLDILYKVGEVSEVEYQTTVKINNNDVKIYNGNYLESIEFYHLDENGEKVDSVFVKGSDSRPYIKLYEKPDSTEEVLHNSYGDIVGNVGDYFGSYDTLYSDITYHLGDTLMYDENLCSYVPVEKRHRGVKYIDTISVIKNTGNFYFSDETYFTFIYYELKGNMSSEKLKDYNDVMLVNMAYFEMQIMNSFINKATEFKSDYWENNNGLIATPVFRTEYDIWSSTPQNLKGNIYIDRGISAAFEKYLKIGEIHTNEALENYGNGYFKIINE